MSRVFCDNPSCMGMGSEDETCGCPDGLNTRLELTLVEAKTLERILLKEYINYEDREAHEVANKIMRFAREEEK